MPKVIDKFVLEQKIGNGQFGQVYKGCHQDTMQVVAIKTINREMIKGKFYELLESQIKVLKSCDNQHIIKLIALKKTPHNYYLMLEYCNSGDMLGKIKKQGPLPEVKILKYLSQILNAFQTLVSHKIMHRDFKLANILIHDDNIKIADFGFAKLLSGDDYTSTMLGSPLNMAPQVLGNSKYNSKADIWSIGACIYEMTYGQPPFVAANMVDLLKLIKTKPLKFPSQPQISKQLKDVILKMLTVDVKKRIQWKDLFNHPVNTLLSRMRRNEAELQLVEDQSLLLNSSKCYLKHNLVLSDVSQIKQNAQVNEYLVNIVRKGHKQNLPGEQQKKEINSGVYSRKQQALFKKNSKIILHYRNIYAFLASLADSIINWHLSGQQQVIAYVLVRKIIDIIQWLLQNLDQDNCALQDIVDWQNYKKSQQFSQIRDYIIKEHEVFSIFNKSLQPIIKKKALEEGDNIQLRRLLIDKLEEQMYQDYLKQFCKNSLKTITLKTLEYKQVKQFKNEWSILYYLLSSINLSITFGKATQNFDFNEFRRKTEKQDETNLLRQIESLAKRYL